MFYHGLGFGKFAGSRFSGGTFMPLACGFPVNKQEKGHRRIPGSVPDT